MLVELSYPLKKEVLLQMLEMKLELEEDSTMVLELIRFVKKQIIELEHDNSEGDEKHGRVKRKNQKAAANKAAGGDADEDDEE
ncbi:hypothetical protein Tco_1200915 [Tanacetum coccineum]